MSRGDRREWKQPVSTSAATFLCIALSISIHSFAGRRSLNPSVKKGAMRAIFRIICNADRLKLLVLHSSKGERGRRSIESNRVLVHPGELHAAQRMGSECATRSAVPMLLRFYLLKRGSSVSAIAEQCLVSHHRDRTTMSGFFIRAHKKIRYSRAFIIRWSERDF